MKFAQIWIALLEPVSKGTQEDASTSESTITVSSDSIVPICMKIIMMNVMFTMILNK